MRTLPHASSCLESTVVGSSTISVFITNLGKYNEGELVGEWLALPTTSEHVTQCLERIGIDGIQYEEFFLTDYESLVNGVSDYISEYSNLNELNYLASKLEELSNNDIEIYEAIIDIGGHVQSVADLINLVDNLDCFQCLWNVNDEYDLGYYWIEESGGYNLKELGNLANYFDYEKYGHDIALEQGGTFYSSGYVYHTGESFTEDYDGKYVPEKYCVLSNLNYLEN
ncbi:antirestriction protein ArdA [Gilliamella sp. wkB112]|uniref:antirestriction protein ArdA n=1 Tax=Gilliamella sp. wkB112 TaxID=3120257 RepID=UPI00080E4F05|nr:antirestriction protein ArdA [Gilliamella apicola]OCG05259.1 antirestriction protein ArdA [Gilliamella apicola]